MFCSLQRSISRGQNHQVGFPSRADHMKIREAYVEIDPTLQFVDEQGEYMLWKKAVARYA